MGKSLVLAEKPSVAREIARVMGCGQKGGGCFIGQKYIVTWALGHLVTLADPEAYDDRYKSWKIEDLPMLPKKMELAVIRETSRQFGIVKGLMHRDDVDELIIATDSGREGELVARWIMEKAGFRKPVKRLWISSQTDKAIKDGFSNLKPGRDFDNLYMSAQSRAEADWLVGLNVTRALTCKYNAQLSAGRVQTPTLAMIIEREDEIRRFVPRDYWTINANMPGFTAIWHDKAAGCLRIFDRKQTDSIIAKVSGQTGRITGIRKEIKKDLPPLAYDLTELQRDANRKYGYSAKNTLSVMQRLYESHKLVTYPRTDSRYITDDIVPTLPERLKCVAVGPYAKMAQNVIRNKITVTKRFADNSKVTDHHAIIPTEQYVDLASLNTEERNIYDLIVKRFLAVLYPSCEYEQVSIEMDINGESFSAKGKTVKVPGWKSVYEYGNADDEDDEYDGYDEEGREDGGDQTLPDLQKGQPLKVLSVKACNKKTKPPARYTEATLLSAMEHPGKFVQDKGLKETLESVSGLGTPATRADIIEKLFSTFYIERKGKEIMPTSKGIQLAGLVPSDLKSPELTAKWEQQLSMISKGKADPSSFIAGMKDYASRLVGSVVANAGAYRHDNLTREKCQCGKYLLEVNGKKGKMLVCSDRECGFRKTVSTVSNARCPECHKKMEIRGEGENRTFICACGYREKLDAFKERKEQQVNKREVSKYLDRQNNDTQINSALADALTKWKK